MGAVGAVAARITRAAGGAVRRGNAAASQRRVAQADRLAQARELQRALDELLGLHRQEFVAATPPQAPPPPAVNAAAVVKDHERRALRGIGVFQRDARKRARAAAREVARQHIAQLEAERVGRWRQAQHELDTWWAALLRNQPDAVLPALAEAFEDNEAPAAAVGVDGAEVAIVALVPGIDAMPERKPVTTVAGNLSLKKLTKSERASLHTTAVASHILLTLREAFAVAPGLFSARIVALLPSVDSYGNSTFDAILAARFERGGLDNVRWDQANAIGIVEDAATELVLNARGVTRELKPLDLRHEPELAALLHRIEPGELGQLPEATETTEAAVTLLPEPTLTSPYAPPAPSPSAPGATTALRAAVAVAWLLLLVVAATTGGFGGLLVALGLPLAGIGVFALAAGQARWAWLRNRQTAAIALMAGFLLAIIGGAVTPTPTPAPAAVGAPSSAPTTTTPAPTTTTPVPAQTTAIVAPPLAPATSPATAPATVPAPKTTRTTAKPPPPPRPTTTTTRAQSCHPSYPTVCIPPGPPDLDCGDIPYRRFTVLPPDPHRLDGSDNDGIGCESG